MAASPEIGYTVFLSEGDAQRVFAFLKRAGYSPDTEGIEHFLLDAARGKAKGPQGPRADAIRQAITSPEALALVRDYAPVAVGLAKRFLRRG